MSRHDSGSTIWSIIAGTIVIGLIWTCAFKALWHWVPITLAIASVLAIRKAMMKGK